jgi:hypothetical protein
LHCRSALHHWNLLLLGLVIVLHLVVDSSPGKSPHQLGGLLSLVKHVAGLGGTQDDRLYVTITIPSRESETNATTVT